LKQGILFIKKRIRKFKKTWVGRGRGPEDIATNLYKECCLAWVDSFSVKKGANICKGKNISGGKTSSLKSFSCPRLLRGGHVTVGGGEINRRGAFGKKKGGGCAGKKGGEKKKGTFIAGGYITEPESSPFISPDRGGIEGG